MEHKITIDSVGRKLSNVHSLVSSSNPLVDLQYIKIEIPSCLYLNVELATTFSFSLPIKH